MWQDLGRTRVAAAAFAAMALFWGGLAALMPQIKARAGVGDTELGLLLLLATSGAALTVLSAGRVERVLDGRGMPVGVLALVLALVLVGMAPGPGLLAVGLVLAGAGSGLLDVSVNVHLARLEQEAGRGLMNLAHGAYALSYAGAALAAGLAREAGVPLQATLWAAALGALGLALAVRRAREPLSAQAEGAAKAPALAPGLVVAGGAVILVGFLAEQATDGWSALHLERNAGAGAAAAALGPVILGLTMGAGRLMAQALLARLDEARLLRWAAGLAALGTALAAWAPGLAWTWAGFALMGLGASVIVPLALALVGRGAGEAGRMRAISRASVIGYAGFFIGPPAMGALSDWQGLGLSFAALACCFALIPLVLGPWLASAARRG